MPRKNGLEARPYVDPGYKLHRMGEGAARRLQNLFSDVDENVGDMYAGVHVTEFPIVAAAYALPRRRFSENDFGLEDVSDPPVLLGIRPRGDVLIDADGYSTAEGLLEVAKAFREHYQTTDNEFDHQHFLNSIDAQDELYVPDYVRSCYLEFDDGHTTLDYLGGNIGNQPDRADFLDGVITLLKKGDWEDDEDQLRQMALEIAVQIVPQGRILDDIPEDDIVSIYVLAAYPDAEHQEDAFGSIAHFEKAAEYCDIAELNELLMNDAIKIYGENWDEVEFWHGTVLSSAVKALPGLFDFKLKRAAIAAGEAYDLEALEEDYEDLKEEDY